MRSKKGKTMAKLNRECIICRHRYSFCPTCAADANKPTWMTIFCGENCKDIYTTLDGYRDNRLSKEDAKEILNKLDLSPIEKLPKNFQDIFSELMVETESISVDETENKKEIIKEIKKPRQRKVKVDE